MISVNLFARHFLPKMNTFQQTHLSNEKCYDSSHQIDGKVTSNIPSLYTFVSCIIYLTRLWYLVNSKLMIKYQIAKEQITRQDGYTFISNPVGLFSCLFFVMFLFWCFSNVYNNAKIILVLEKHAIEKHIWNEIFAQEYNKGGEFICPNETCKKGIIVFMNAYLVQIGS